MHLRLYVTVAAMLSASLASKADTLTTFNLSGQTATSPNITIGGSLVLDVTTGTVSSNNLTVSQGGSTENFLNDVTYAGNPLNSTAVYVLQFGTFDTPAGSLSLDFNLANLVGYNGGSVCSVASPCSTGATSTAEFGANFGTQLDTASLTPQAAPPPPPPLSVTPEPSSFALLGTGLLGVAGLLKRRLA